MFRSADRSRYGVRRPLDSTSRPALPGSPADFKLLVAGATLVIAAVLDIAVRLTEALGVPAPGSIAGRIVFLQPMASNVAIAFLLDRTGQADGAAAAEVAETLGCLPPALEQASAFIIESGLQLSRYVELARTRLRELLQDG